VKRRNEGRRKTRGNFLAGHSQILFRDLNGVRHRETYETWRQAKAELDKRRTSVRERKYVAPADIPAIEQVARAWR
jgi:hypothetical protein